MSLFSKRDGNKIQSSQNLLITFVLNRTGFFFWWMISHVTHWLDDLFNQFLNVSLMKALILISLTFVRSCALIFNHFQLSQGERPKVSAYDFVSSLCVDGPVVFGASNEVTWKCNHVWWALMGWMFSNGG